MHQTLVVTLPAGMFGKQKFEPDDRLQLGVAINDLLNQSRTTAEIRLQLVGKTAKGDQARGLTSAGE
jgi:hypothetical protein